MYSAAEIADYIIRKGISTGNPVSNMKLQGLLYFSQAFYLVVANGKRLFDERLYKWDWGPVCPYVFERYKFLVDRPIEKPFLSEESVKPSDALAIRVLDYVWELFEDKSANLISELTMREPPVAQTPFNQEVEPARMHRHYMKLTEDRLVTA